MYCNASWLRPTSEKNQHGIHESEVPHHIWLLAFSLHTFGANNIVAKLHWLWACFQGRPRRIYAQHKQYNRGPIRTISQNPMADALPVCGFHAPCWIFWHWSISGNVRFHIGKLRQKSDEVTFWLACEDIFGQITVGYWVQWLSVTIKKRMIQLSRRQIVIK